MSYIYLRESGGYPRRSATRTYLRLRRRVRPIPAGNSAPAAARRNPAPLPNLGRRADFRRQAVARKSRLCMRRLSLHGHIRREHQRDKHRRGGVFSMARYGANCRRGSTALRLRGKLANARYSRTRQSSRRPCRAGVCLSMVRYGRGISGKDPKKAHLDSGEVRRLRL